MNDNRIDFSTVLASSVHDMKNSVGMLLASIEEIVARSPPQDDAQAKDFSTLHYEASRINGELIQVLALYRMEEEFLPVRIDQHYIVDILEEQIARNHSLCETSGIQIDMNCDENLHWYYDDDLIGGVIHNIIVNCIRYTKSHILVSASLDGDLLCISISDDGNGYPETMLSNPSHLIDRGKLSKGTTHLGLYFASLIARLHTQHNRHGYIKLSNNGPLGGGMFQVFLP